MRLVVNLRQMLKVQPCVDLCGGDAGVAQQFLHRTQITAGLQHMAGKGMAQHVRMHRRGQPSGARALPEPYADMLGRQTRAAPADEQRCVVAHGDTRIHPGPTHRNPSRQCGQCRATHRYRPPLGAFAQHMHLASVLVNPATGLRAAVHIQPHQLCNAQAAAIQQFSDAMVTQRHALLVFSRDLSLTTAGADPVIGRQLHRFVHTQRFRQRFGRFGGTHTEHRVAVHQTRASQPAVKPAPSRQN